jgi:hypothetical protein
MIIYVKLVEEGAEVWRPAQAKEVKEGWFLMLPAPDYPTLDEQWEFPPGSVVRCEKRVLSGDEVLVAISPKRETKWHSEAEPQPRIAFD